MKSRWIASLFALPLFAPAAAAGSGAAPVRAPTRTTTVSESTRTKLESLFDKSLDSLRAGAVAAPASMRDDERAALRAAQSRSADLQDLRAGDGVGTVLLVLVIVILIILVV